MCQVFSKLFSNINTLILITTPQVTAIIVFNFISEGTEVD